MKRIATEKVELDLTNDIPPSQHEQVLMRPIQNHPVLVGLYIPRDTQMTKSINKTAWFEAIQMIMSKGVYDPAEISAATGLKPSAVKELQERVYEDWGKTLTPDVVNVRREKLYTEIERIKTSAWDYYTEGKRNGADVREQGALLKLILESTSHQAKMCGVSNLNLNLTHQVETKFKTNEDFEREASDLLRVDSSVLKSLGSALAQSMKQEEDE